MGYDFMGPFDMPCLNPKSYRELPSPPKPDGVWLTVCAQSWQRSRDIIASSIESIFNQGFPAENYEVILIDDASGYTYPDSEGKKDYAEAVEYLINEYPDHNLRAYTTERTRCFCDAHPLNVCFKRALGKICMISQTDIIHVGETLESAWRHHNNRSNLRLCPAHYGMKTDDLTYSGNPDNIARWGEEAIWSHPHEFGASFPTECAQKVRGRNETIRHAPPDVSFQGYMVRTCGIVARVDPDVSTIHRKAVYSKGIKQGIRGFVTNQCPIWYDGDSGIPWTTGNWGELTPSEENSVVMTEKMREALKHG